MGLAMNHILACSYFYLGKTEGSSGWVERYDIDLVQKKNYKRVF